MKLGLGQKVRVDDIDMVCVSIKTDFSGDHYTLDYFSSGELKTIEVDPGWLDAMEAFTWPDKTTTQTTK